MERASSPWSFKCRRTGSDISGRWLLECASETYATVTLLIIPNPIGIRRFEGTLTAGSVWVGD